MKNLTGSKLLACLVSGAMTCVAVTGSAQAPIKAPASRIAFEKYTLPNGLTVILHEDHKLPFVHVNEWIHVGSKNEKPGRTGFAHLFEHLMFEGSKNATGKYISLAEKLGANLFSGGVNGTTNNDRTNYFITAPSGSLETMLWLESDRIATLGDALTKENLDHQRDVVKNERRQGLENQPYGRAFKLMDENLFPMGHPYSWQVIGSHEDLSAATFEDVKDFFKTYYVPNNLAMVITGDFDPVETKKLVAKYWGGIPAGPALDRPAHWIPKLEGEKVVEVKDRVAQERVYLTWPAPAFFEAEGAELDLAASILSDGLASRLQKALVFDKALCTEVNAFYWDREISGSFVVLATARPGVSLAETERIIGEEIARFAKEGPTAEELGRAQTKFELGFMNGLERIGGFGGKADRLAIYETFLGDPGKFETDLGRYARATPGSVRQAVDHWINNRNRVVVRFHPETAGRADATPLDRSVKPASTPDRPFHAPQSQSAKLPNGLEVLVVPRPELPKVAFTWVSKVGSMADPQGKEGLVNLAWRVLDKGTKARQALDIENALGNLGVTLSGSVAREYASVSFEVLKRNLGPALDLVSDVIQHPTFPATTVEMERKKLLDRLAQDATNPNALAARIGPALLFGADHPYGRPESGLAETVARITAEDLVKFHGTMLKPANSALVFSGDITLKEARDLAAKWFGGWSGQSAALTSVPLPKPIPGKVFAIDRQDAAQTLVAQVLLAPRRKAEDYYALQLVDAVWGGGFNTRLNMNLREDKGYSYGAFSSLQPYSTSGLWMASAGVQSNKTKESVAEFQKELDFLGGGRLVSDKEVADAKANRVRGFAQQFETLGSLQGQVAGLWAAGLPMTELQREYDETDKATLPMVLAAERKYVKPSEARLLLIGDREKILATAKELTLGEVVFLTPEGKPIPPK